MYSKMSLTMNKSDPTLVFVKIESRNTEFKNLLQATHTSSFRLPSSISLKSERILSEIIESDSEELVNKEHFRSLIYFLVSICAVAIFAVIGLVIYMLMEADNVEKNKVSKNFSSKKTDTEMQDLEREARYNANLFLFNTINGKPMDNSDLYY